jgi:hypothetical protein
MARAKNVTIKLTPKQRAELHRLTGQEHSEVMFESVKTYRNGAIGSKATLARKSAPKMISEAKYHVTGVK